MRINRDGLSILVREGVSSVFAPALVTYPSVFLYDVAQPADIEAPVTETILETMGAAVAGSRYIEAPVDGRIQVAGGWSRTFGTSRSPTWFRIFFTTDEGGGESLDGRLDGTITTIGGGGDLQLASTTFGSGDTLTIPAIVIDLSPALLQSIGTGSGP